MDIAKGSRVAKIVEEGWKISGLVDVKGWWEQGQRLFGAGARSHGGKQ